VTGIAQLEKDAVLLKQPEQAGPGTVAVATDEAGRYTRFAIAMQGLLCPIGSRTLWQVGNDIAGNRNGACAQADGDWVWFIDDDHTFAPDILLRLLARDVDIVAPLCLRRVQPFHPVACDLDGRHLDVTRYAHGELVEVEHTGSSGMLIRRRVLEQVEAPWFELGNGVSEDVAFCRKAREAGFLVHVDMGVPLGHITTAVVWPTNTDGAWYTGFDIADGASLLVDPPKPEDG
jgi:hypothetical protein